MNLEVPFCPPALAAWAKGRAGCLGVMLIRGFLQMQKRCLLTVFEVHHQQQRMGGIQQSLTNSRPTETNGPYLKMLINFIGLTLNTTGRT